MTSSWPRWPTSFRHVVLLGSLALGGTSCAPVPSIVRTRGSVNEAGRPIPPHAYAFFLSALQSEAAGIYEHAKKLYVAALRSDPHSGAAWAGLIRTTCQLGHRDIEGTLSSALQASDRPALPLVAYAECKLKPSPSRSGDSLAEARRAETASRRAIKSEPGLRSASLALIRSLQTQGRARAATRARVAYQLFVGEPLQQDQIELTTTDRTAALDAIDLHVIHQRTQDAVDATAGYITLGELSVRMLALGRPDSAAIAAQQVLFNEPSNLDAQLVLVLGRRPPPAEELSRILNMHLQDHSTLSALGQALLANELERTERGSGHDYLRQLNVGAPSGDQLLDLWLSEIER